MSLKVTYAASNHIPSRLRLVRAKGRSVQTGTTRRTRKLTALQDATVTNVTPHHTIHKGYVPHHTCGSGSGSPSLLRLPSPPPSGIWNLESPPRRNFSFLPWPCSLSTFRRTVDTTLFLIPDTESVLHNHLISSLRLCFASSPTESLTNIRRRPRTRSPDSDYPANASCPHLIHLARRASRASCANGSVVQNISSG